MTALDVSSATTVVLPVPPDGGDPEPRRSTGGLRRDDLLAVAAAAAGSLGLTMLLFRLLPFSGLLGGVVLFWVLFVALYARIVSSSEDGPAVRDRVVGVIVHSLAALMLLVLVFVIVYTLWRGRRALVHLNFFSSDMTLAGPLQPLSVGGITHAVVGTLEEIAIALLATVPLGVTCAVFLNEIPGRFTRLVRTVAEAMTAIPSIVCGLFIYTTLILSLGVEKSAFAAGLAISVEMLPIIIRAADVVLRLVPGALKEASLAVGATHWRTVWHVVLPTARSGLTTAVILGTARGIGESAPVLLTAGFTTRLNTDPLHGPMNSLPLATFYFVKSPEPSMIARGFGTASVLMLLVLALFTAARVVGGRGAGQLSRRQARARLAASGRDLARISGRRVTLAAARKPPAVIDLTTAAPSAITPEEWQT